MSVRKSAAIFAAACLAVAPMASAAVYTFQDGVDGYDGTQDVSLYGGSLANANTGALAVVFVQMGVGGSKGLLKFDVSSLAGQTVTGTPTVTVTIKNTSIDAPETIGYSVYTVSDDNAGWSQGGGVFDAATDGEADYNYRSVSATSTPWAGSAGLSTAGVDYNDLVQTGTVSQLPSSEGTQLVITLSPTLVQHWIDVANGGLLFVHDSGDPGALQFYSSEETDTPSYRPRLDLEAAAVPEPASMALLGMLGLGLLGRRRRI